MVSCRPNERKSVSRIRKRDLEDEDLLEEDEFLEEEELEVEEDIDLFDDLMIRLRGYLTVNKKDFIQMSCSRPRILNELT